MIYIPHVEGKLLLPGKRIPAIHLCPTRYARQDLMAAKLGRGIAIAIVRVERAWSDKTHFTVQDVHQLRKLIETRSSQEAANRRQPLSVGQQLTIVGTGVGHCTKLSDEKRSALKPKSFLGKQHRRPEMNTHHECDDDKERQHYRQSQNAEDNIQDSLNSPSINSRGTIHLRRSQSPIC